MKDQNQHKSVAKKWWWVMSATIFALLAVLTAILIEGQIIGLRENEKKTDRGVCSSYRGFVIRKNGEVNK